MSTQVHCLFFNWGFGFFGFFFAIEVYEFFIWVVLHIDPDWTCGLQISFPLCWLLSLCWWLGLLSSLLVTVDFVACALGVIARKPLPGPRSRSSAPRFPFRSFMVWRLTRKSFTHSELIFVSDVQYGSSLILSHVNIRLSQLRLLKRLSFLHWVFLAPLSNASWPCMFRAISGLSSVPLVCLSVFMPLPHCPVSAAL